MSMPGRGLLCKGLEAGSYLAGWGSSEEARVVEAEWVARKEMRSERQGGPANAGGPL